jgi:hypothetical protein
LTIVAPAGNQAPTNASAPRGWAVYPMLAHLNTSSQSSCRPRVKPEVGVLVVGLMQPISPRPIPVAQRSAQQ